MLSLLLVLFYCILFMPSAYSLRPVFDSVKSFYNKATVDTKADGTETLYSYNTKVAQIKNGKLSLFGYYSQTTARHVNEFLQQNGLNRLTKSEMLKQATK